MKEFIAYDGDAFVIEWFFDTSGKSDVLNYFESLSDTQKRKTLMLFKRMGDFGKIYDKTKFRHEGDKIYAFKPQPDRFLSFFYSGNKIIVTHGFKKKSQKIPDSEKKKALQNMRDYIKRNLDGQYYAK